MQKLLTSNIIPSNHPIMVLPEKLKIRYLKGLGEALCLIEPNSQMGQKAKFCYDVLCELFLGKTLEGGWEVTKDLRHIKKAQKLCRSGLKIFRMSDCFWWDVYRIAYQSGLPIESYDAELKKATGRFTSRFRESASEHFLRGDNGGALHKILIAQSKEEFHFRQRPLKRILVVGTMSAGKSTLVNALVGADIAKVKTSVCTTDISYIYNNPFCDGIIYFDEKSIEYDSTLHLNDIALPNKAVRFSNALSSHPLVIIDTPGVDYAYDESHKEITLDAINRKDYDVLLCVINASYYERNGENEIIDHIINQNIEKVIFIFNQLDRFKSNKDSIEESLNLFRALLKSKKCNANIIPLSAKTVNLLIQEQNNTLDELDALELALLKKKFKTGFYDLGKYDIGVQSEVSDFFTRSGFTNLINTILNQ